VSVEDERSGRPNTTKTTASIKKILELVHEHRCRAMTKFAGTLGISYGVCQKILAENLN
jgi:hypothetical protein